MLTFNAASKSEASNDEFALELLCETRQQSTTHLEPLRCLPVMKCPSAVAATGRAVADGARPCEGFDPRLFNEKYPNPSSRPGPISIGEGVLGNPASVRPTEVDVETVGAARGARKAGGREVCEWVLRILERLVLPSLFDLDMFALPIRLYRRM